MNFKNGSMVIVSAFKKFKVGMIVDKLISKRGVTYIIKTEDGKVYDNVRVDSEVDNTFIHSALTNSFLKSKNHKDGT
jgi:hypothetical protein